MPSPSRDLPEPSRGTGTSLPIICGAVILNKRKGGDAYFLPMMPSGGRGEGKKNIKPVAAGL